MVLPEHDLHYLLPLISGGITSCRIVGTNLKHDNLAIRLALKVFQHALVVEYLFLGIVIAIVGRLESCSLSDLNVEGPRGIWYKNLSVLERVEVSQKLETKSNGTSP